MCCSLAMRFNQIWPEYPIACSPPKPLKALLQQMTLSFERCADKPLVMQINAMNERQYRKYVRWSEKQLLDMEKQVHWLQQAKRVLLHKVSFQCANVNLR
jgi:hypothetical protein